MKLDPIALRKRWDPNPNRQRLYDWAAGLEVWRNRTPAAQTGRYRRGVGVATGYWLYLWQPGSKVELAVKDGRLVASTAIQDIGTGSRTVIANTVAQANSDWSRMRSRCGSAIPSCRKDRVRAAAGPRLRSSADAAGRSKAQGRDRTQCRAAAAPGSNAPWRELLAASPDLTASARKAGGQQANGPGDPVAAEGGGLHGDDIRLDDAPFLQYGGGRAACRARCR